MVLRHLNRVTIDKQARAVGEERMLTELKERIRALAESPHGWIYFSTDSGKVYRIKPTSPVDWNVIDISIFKIGFQYTNRKPI